MTEPDLYALTQRLERLEPESRRWKAVASVLAIVAVTIATIGATAAPPADIQARSLMIGASSVLNDTSGTARAVLGDTGLRLWLPT